ncbi:circadian clock-controlled protein daywake [Helicoverpa armigera]|uniref:circadian clock-controlled protein daywake n=1 Tax=Helicoverpa armigera TaxID=29058 RepID=UPI0030838D5B
MKMWSGILCLVVVPLVAGFDKFFINFGGFVCPREEKALGKCLRDALNAYIPQLATGVPEYGVPPCEPMVVPALSIQQSTGPISVKSSYSDVSVRGPSSMRVKDVESLKLLRTLHILGTGEFDPSTDLRNGGQSGVMTFLGVDSHQHRVVARLYIPELRMKGHYRLEGNLLMLPIDGEGQFSAKYGEIDATVTIVLGRQPRHNDVDSLKCKELDVSFHVGYASMKLENLFGDDGDLSNTMNQFLNDNWQKLLEELQTPMEDALRDFLKPLADHAFSTLNADDILSQ